MTIPTQAIVPTATQGRVIIIGGPDTALSPDSADLTSELEAPANGKTVADLRVQPQAVVPAVVQQDEKSLPNIIGRTFGKHYLVKSFIKSGGMAHVYLGIDTCTNTPCAIKVMKTPDLGTYDPRLLKRFIRESQSMGKLAHPNIVSVFGADENFIAMELVTGGTLGSRKDKLSLQEQLLIIADICDGLYYAHNKGIVHRDLKLDNILLSDELTNGTYPPHPVGKISDFGINFDMNASKITTDHNSLLGTVHYMAPEHIKTSLSDLYSIGVILYELTTGVKPFSGSMAQIMYNHQTQVPVPPNRKIEELGNKNDKISPALEELIMCLLQKKQEARNYKNASLLATGLRNIVMPPKGKIKLPLLAS